MHIVDYQIVEKEKDILQAAEDFAYRNCDRMENPNGQYHGNINISHRKPLNNYQEAYDYIEYHTKNSINYDMAVRFYDTDNLQPTEKEEQLKEKIQIKNQKLKEYIIKNKLTTKKSAFLVVQRAVRKLLDNTLKNTNYLNTLLSTAQFAKPTCVPKQY